MLSTIHFKCVESKLDVYGQDKRRNVEIGDSKKFAPFSSFGQKNWFYFTMPHSKGSPIHIYFNFLSN